MALTVGKTAWDFVVVALVAGASLLAVGLVSAAPDRTGSHVVLVYAPWSSAADTLARASASGARLIRKGRFDFVVLVEPTTSDFVASLAGAWMMFDAAGLGGCLSAASETIDAAAR